MLQDFKGLRWVAGGVLGLAGQFACAAVISYTAQLDGSTESPPNSSPGTGMAIVTVDTTGHTMRVEANFSGLQGLVTAAHIQCCTAVAGEGNVGVATMVPSFPGFPSGVSAGAYDHLFDLLDDSSWNAGFITSHGGTAASAEADLFAGLAAGKAYFNIHSDVFAGGEIRGFLTAQIPEPASAVLTMLGLAALGLARVRRKAGASPGRTPPWR